ncbi:hypothetical protein C2S52_016727 [Perilla frutescens var. hirtella]|nr:hypothetical protein C2S52_016727 [Perilla frutescens var. hirtella]
MGDKKTLEMARKELEEMYVGVPDDSVNLSFQELAQVMHKNIADKKKQLSPSSTMVMDPISESPALAKLPSLDFNRALQEASHNHQIDHSTPHHHHTHPHGSSFRPSPAMDQRSFVYDDMSHVSAYSQQRGRGRGGGERRRRPGIPHSNICTICSTYTYFFRHRCLVCGRVYCRQCVAIGMGEMAEGRKCIDCLGRRFSQRYINKAGNIGCCLGYGYPSTVKQQELKWAEKGPRTTGETVYGHHRSMVAPTPTATGAPPTPISHHHNPPSFVANSPYSHNTHHFMPL